ncbi:hypothetical protein [Actinocrispum wychmicini]|uniref:Scaffolding protein n=1 Tax=Actinocrispum wychmicini TaxID=1213861 RepID=A0A4V2S8L4_9PSEU|nr:hypothetical protein [Actinocrispum wychmicini]TCO64380.1 hypothetical protein EV192_101148 [Actinocrispum wychmicini]
MTTPTPPNDPAPTPESSPPSQPPTPDTPPPPSAENTDSSADPANQPPNAAVDVEALRAEVADWRTRFEGAQQGIVDKIATALGIGTDEAPTVEQVTDQLTAAQRDARERAVDLAVYRAAGMAGADPDALLDSTAFRKRVAELDPAADGFAAKVTAAITAAVKDNPRLATSPATAPRSGAEITGGSPSGSDDLGSLPVEDYIKRTRKGRS